jgi:hypothetical protein
MNHYRFRLVLATASLTAALTVLSLKLGGFLSPVSSDSIVLTASKRIDSQSVSPYRLACQHQLATLVQPQQKSIAALQVFDPQGRIIACKFETQGRPADQ